MAAIDLMVQSENFDRDKTVVTEFRNYYNLFIVTNSKKTLNVHRKFGNFVS